MSSSKNTVSIFSQARRAFLSRYKNIVSIFSLVKTVFFNFFCISNHKILGSEYSTEDNESPKNSIGAITKNSKMLKFVPDQLKTKNMCKHAVKELPFVIRYVPDWYKTQQMYDKAILENDGTFRACFWLLQKSANVW